MINLVKGSLFATAFLLVASSNTIANDYSGLNFSLGTNATKMNTWFSDIVGHQAGGNHKNWDYSNVVAGFSWEAGYDKKWDSVLPFNRDLYTGLEIGGTYLTDDNSSHHIGAADYVEETHFRGHHVISGGIELGFDLGQQKVSFDTGGALANINNISWDNDFGRMDFNNSPHTQDLVSGYYVGMEIERLLTQNFGVKFGIRHYDFGALEEQWINSVNKRHMYYKYDNTLTQTQIGLVYYLRQKNYYPQYGKSSNAIANKPINNKIKKFTGPIKKLFDWSDKNGPAKDYSGLNFNIAANATSMNTYFRDYNFHQSDSHSTWDYSNAVAGFSWEAGYDKKWDSVLPFNRDLYTGLEIGGTYLTDDNSSHHIGSGDFVEETHFRGHHVISGGLELGFNLGQQKVSFDGGAALANINHISWDEDNGATDFDNSPHTQDLVSGYYVGMEIEHLYTQNFGVKFGIRHYDFGALEQHFQNTANNKAHHYKFDDTLTQAQFGLVYYLRQK